VRGCLVNRLVYGMRLKRHRMPRNRSQSDLVMPNWPARLIGRPTRRCSGRRFASSKIRAILSARIDYTGITI